MTDSKSVGSNTVRVRPPPSAPKNNTPLNKRGIIFWCGGRENPQLAGKAWMPYKMNAQSFARCETNRAFINVQGCTIAVAQSRYARMHKDSHTKPLHDATAQMAVGARTRRPKRPQTQGCVIVLAQSFARMRNQQSKHDVHGCTMAVAQSRCTMQRPKRPQFDTPLHFRPLNKRGIIFGAAGGRTRNLRVRHGCLIK